MLGRIIQSLADLSEEEAKKRTGITSQGQRKIIQGQRPVTQGRGISAQGRATKQCQYWNCNRAIRANHFLCSEHYEDWEDYIIDKCPECGRYKDVEFDTCKDCYDKLKKEYTVKKPSARIRIEHSKAWEKADEGVEKFFVYILKDEMSRFYVGHTRDLRVRLGEHRDGKTKSTAGKNQKLQYFEEVGSRKSAELREVELKELVNNNERQIRKMIQNFQDRVREVQIG